MEVATLALEKKTIAVLARAILKNAKIIVVSIRLWTQFMA